MKKISVLMIGNSFSVDAARYTHELSLGSDVEIELGVLYVGGCSFNEEVGLYYSSTSQCLFWLKRYFLSIYQ